MSVGKSPVISLPFLGSLSDLVVSSVFLTKISGEPSLEEGSRLNHSTPQQRSQIWEVGFEILPWVFFFFFVSDLEERGGNLHTSSYFTPRKAPEYRS